MKKKLVAVVLAGMMAASFVACGGDKSADKSAEAPSAKSEMKAESAVASSAKSEADTSAASLSNADPISMDMDGKGVKVGFVVKSLADQYWILTKAGAEQAAKKYGVELTFIAPNSESDVQKQVENIETVTSAGVDVICVAPSNDETVLPALQSAVDAGIKVIAVDGDSSLPDKLSFIGTGNEEAAKIGAEWAAKQIGSGKQAILLRGRLGDQTHDLREAGIKAGLKAGGVEVLETQAADSSEEKALQITENLLQRYPDVSLIITTADSMATGALNAVEKAGNTKVKVYGFDGTIPVSQKVAEGGQMIGTTGQYPYNMGVLGIQNAIKAAKGEKIEPVINSGQIVVNKDNAAAFIADLKAKIGEK